jgi:CHAD domain-containing protein
MAKALPIPQLKLNSPISSCLPAIVDTRIKEIRSFKKGVLKGAPDSVHDMRVACRRLQTVLIIFAEFIEKGPLRKFKKQLRRLTRRLGTVRQSDVLIEMFSACVKTTDDKQQTVRNLLLARYSTQRKEAGDMLVKLLTEIDSGKVFEGFFGAVNVSPSKSNTAKKVRREIDNVFFGQVMPDAVGSLVGEFSLGVARAMSQENSSEILHEMRISGKPLRYSMELAGNCFNGGFNDYFFEVKNAIQLLGDIHDIDVATAALDSFSKEIQSYNDAAGRIIEHFPLGFLHEAHEELVTSREKLCVKVRKNLLKWRTDRFFKKFLALLAKASD